MTHPLIIRGSHIYRNFYYIPPEEFLNQKRAELEVQHWLNNLEREQHIQETLRQSEERYRTLTNQSLVGLVIVQDFRIVFANAAFAKISGYSVDELLSLPAAQVQAMIHPEDQALVWGSFRDRLAGKEVPPVYEYRRIYKDGSIRWLEMHASRVDYRGRPAIQGAIIDITKRRQAEEKYRSILEDMEESYFETDLPGNYTFVNDAWCRALGYSREEAIGMSFRKVIAEEDIDEVFRAFNQVYRTKEALKRGLVCRVVRKDGSIGTSELSAFPLWDERGEIIGFRGIGTDVTQRNQAEKALQQSEEKYRTILKEIEDSYFEVDLAGNLTFVNDATCLNLRYSREELLGMNYRNFTAEEDMEHVFQTFNQVYRTGEPNKGFTWKIIRKDGSIGFADASVSPLRSPAGEIIGFRGVGRDITERRKAEEERKQLELKAQITSRLASVGEMASGVAHEINNPLTGVIGYAQLLMDRKDIPPDIRKDLEAINDGAQRVANIVQRLLTFSRQTKPERKLVDINELIESTLVLRAYHLKVNSIEVATHLTPGLLETVVDPGQIQQVLLNLIVNAETEMKLAHGKGKLIITTEKTDNTIKISIKDDGPGIKPEVMDRIFDPFFTTRAPGQGTGLGLSLCYGIVNEHKGTIYAESQPGKGATFIVELPVVTGVTPAKLSEPVVDKYGKKIKGQILVVDDEQVVRDVASRILTREGHCVETVDNATDAIKKIKNNKYDIILLDIKMPHMSGVTLYKRIQKINKSLARRIVFITGDVMGVDTKKFLAETEVTHIEKPFDAEQLSREVQRVLIIVQ